MDYEITLSGDDLLTIISLLENAGSAQLAVKVRDQLYEQRRRKMAQISDAGSRGTREASYEDVKRVFDGFFGESQ